MADDGGVSLGTAVGVVRIDAQLEVARAAVKAFAEGTEREFERVNESSLHLTSTLNQLAGAFGVSLGVAGLVQLAKWTDETAKLAAEADRTRQAYDDLASGFGQDADSMLQAMRAASEGMISDSNLVLDANKAMLLGVASNGQEMANLLEVARARGAAMGESTSAAFNDIVTGIGRLSPRILDNLGIVIDSQQAYDEYAKSIDVSADSLTEAEKKHALYLAILKDSKKEVDDQKTHVNDLADQYERLGAAEDNARMAAGKFFAEAGAGNTKFWTDVNNGITRWLDFFRQYSQATDKWHMVDPSNPIGHRTGIGQAHPEAFPTPDRPVDQKKLDDINNAWSDHFDKTAEIQRQADDDLLSENTSYQNRRARSEEQYQENVANSAADFAKQRMRAQEDYENAVLDIMRAAQARDARMAEDHASAIGRMQSDSAKRLGDMQEELDRTNAQKRADSAEKVADMALDHDKEIAGKRADSLDRLSQIEKDYERQREQAARDHADALFDAAAALDGRAIFQEQRRYNRSQAEAEKANAEKVADEGKKLDEAITNLNTSYNEKLADEKKALDKSIQQANEAHDRQVADEQEALQTRIADANDAYGRQLEDARAADAQRITDMAANFEQQKTREDADQADRMGRMADDHAAEMTQMDSEHGERITQIGAHAQEERDALDAEFRKQLLDLGVHNDAYDNAEAQHQQQIMLQKTIFQEQEKKQLADFQKSMLEIYQLNPLTSPAELAAIGTAITALGQQIVTFDTNIGIAQGKLDALPPNPYLLPAAPTTGDQGAPAPNRTVISPSSVPVSAAMTSAGVGGGNVANVSFAQGAVVVYGAPGQSVEALAGIIDQRILRAVTEATRRM